jgi:hypothetical protein
MLGRTVGGDLGDRCGGRPHRLRARFGHGSAFLLAVVAVTRGLDRARLTACPAPT